MSTETVPLCAACGQREAEGTATRILLLKPNGRAETITDLLTSLRKTLAAATELHAQGIGCPDCPPDHEDTGEDCPMLVAAEAALARADGRAS